MERLFTIFTPVLLILMLLSTQSIKSHAQILQNDSYTLEVKDPEDITPAPKRAQIIKKDIKKHQVIGFGELEIILSQNKISFGEINPTDPVKRNISLNPSASGTKSALYQFLDGPLTNSSGTLFPPTSCDSGSCTKDQADTWINNLTFGIGFRCTGTENCPDDFENEDSFRSISFDGIESRSLLLDSQGHHIEAKMGLEHKANSSPAQEAGNYKTGIYYLIMAIF